MSNPPRRPTCPLLVSARPRLLVARLRLACFLFAYLSGSVTIAAGQQTTGSTLPNAPDPLRQDRQQDARTVTLHNTPTHILVDQSAIWTSPARIRAHDLPWLIPLVLAEGAAIATDHRAMNSVVTHDPATNQDSTNASNVLIGGMIALPVGIYGYGHFEQSDHAEESGILGGEAILDGVVVEEGIKLIFWRERPYVDDAHGRFWQSGAGLDSSFPSSHAVLAWATAGALAGEYPSPWAQAGLYTFASAISMTRVIGQQHFPGDVLAGSAAGWLVGHYVFRRHHHADSLDANR